MVGLGILAGCVEEEMANENKLDGWCNVIRRTGDLRRKELREWQAKNPPRAEVATQDVNGDAVVIGLWRAWESDPPGVWYGPKRADGYNLHSLLFLPAAVIKAASKLAKER